MDSNSLVKSRMPKGSGSSGSEQPRKTQLILSQASNDLLQMNELRRGIDGKAFALLTVTLGLLGVIGAFGVWRSLRPNGQPFFIAALIIYLAVIGLGLFITHVKPVFMPCSRAIHEFQNSTSYDDLSEWVAEDLLDLIDAGATIIEKKSRLLEVMPWLIAVGSFLLLVSIIV